MLAHVSRAEAAPLLGVSESAVGDAKAYPDAGLKVKPPTLVNKGRLSTARSVIEHAPWLVDRVIAGI